MRFGRFWLPRMFVFIFIFVLLFFTRSRTNCRLEPNSLIDEFQTLKALIKLSRNMAIFEFSSSNGFSSFTLYFECRTIRIRNIEDEIQSHFSYVIQFPNLGSGTSCQDRGYEELNYYCITFFQGQKCSMIKTFIHFNFHRVRYLESHRRKLFKNPN